MTMELLTVGGLVGIGMMATYFIFLMDERVHKTPPAIKHTCKNCMHVWHVIGYSYYCPHCGSGDIVKDD